MSWTPLKARQFLEQVDAANEQSRRERQELAARHEARRHPSGELEVLFEGGEDEGGLFSGGRTGVLSPSEKTSGLVCVGHVSLAPGEHEGDLKVAKIHIDPFFRRQGFGSRVLAEVIRLARKRGYWAIVGEMDPEAPEFASDLRRFYERLGVRIGDADDSRSLRLELGGMDIDPPTSTPSA